MSNRSRRQNLPETPATLPVPRWIGGSALELVQAFNDRYLECLGRSAQSTDARYVPDFLRTHRRLWVEMGEDARRRASRCPFVLADLQFANADWWRRARSEPRISRGEFGGMFPWIINMELARDVLTVAWYTAREDLSLGTLLIGMSADVAEFLAKLSLHELWQFADRHHHSLRPRCENRSAFWGRLLRAAVRDDRATLHDLHWHAFLLADAGSARNGSGQGSARSPRT